MEETILNQLNLDSSAKNVRIFCWAKLGRANYWNTILKFSGDVPFLKITQYNFIDNEISRIYWDDITELGAQIDAPRQ